MLAFPLPPPAPFTTPALPMLPSVVGGPSEGEEASDARLWALSGLAWCPFPAPDCCWAILGGTVVPAEEEEVVAEELERMMGLISCFTRSIAPPLLLWWAVLGWVGWWRPCWEPWELAVFVFDPPPLPPVFPAAGVEEGEERTSMRFCSSTTCPGPMCTMWTKSEGPLIGSTLRRSERLKGLDGIIRGCGGSRVEKWAYLASSLWFFILNLRFLFATPFAASAREVCGMWSCSWDSAGRVGF